MRGRAWALLGACAAPAAGCASLPQELRWGAGVLHSWDWVCCANAVWAEPAGSQNSVAAYSALLDSGPPDGEPVTYYDAACGLPLFTAPRGRTWQQFAAESRRHGWPSFRPQEAHLDNIVIAPEGEMRSTCGTHLGHNIPDAEGDRYCIDLLCIAGLPPAAPEPAARPAAPAPPPFRSAPPAGGGAAGEFSAERPEGGGAGGADGSGLGTGGRLARGFILTGIVGGAAVLGVLLHRGCKRQRGGAYELDSAAHPNSAQVQPEEVLTELTPVDQPLTVLADK
eukprot:TRINITY_DN15621_c0_g1_i1.p2 TRINITY_DN15621_c0_g1~~TRINITY_DN15621_c0_g1_i1.p2  ORF type:complete len:309 (+),score=88.72 TRINITY_DN15621_c0_g1_i1:87-929(+)